MKRTFILIAGIALLAACGAGEAPEQTAAAAVRVSDTPCPQSGKYDEAAAQPIVFSEEFGDGLGIIITAPEGSSCTGSAADGGVLSCQVSGLFGLTVQDISPFEIPEGRTATLAHANGATTCFLNEEG